MSKMGVLLERRGNFRYASVEGKKDFIQALIRNDGLHERRQDRGGGSSSAAASRTRLSGGYKVRYT